MSSAAGNDHVPLCPTCRAPLERGGDQENRYWSCRDCNLVYLA